MLQKANQNSKDAFKIIIMVHRLKKCYKSKCIFSKTHKQQNFVYKHDAKFILVSTTRQNNVKLTYDKYIEK